MKEGDKMTENSKHAGGRPKAENPLDFDTKVRLTADDAKRLDAYCAAHGIKRAAAIRAAVLQMIGTDAETGKDDDDD